MQHTLFIATDWRSSEHSMQNNTYNGIAAEQTPFAVEWHTLDHETIERVWNMHRRCDAWNARCRAYVLDHIGSDIAFYRRGMRVSPKSEFQELVRTAWAPVIPDIYDAIAVMGVCPLTFRRVNPGDESSPIVPMVPAYGTYQIQVAYSADYNRMLYRVLRRQGLYIDQYESIDYARDQHAMFGAGQCITVTDATYIGACTGHDSSTDFVLGGRSYANSRSFVRDMRASFMCGGSSIPDGWVLDRNTVVLRGFDSDPTIDGEINTRLTTLLQLREFTELHARIMTVNQIQHVTRPIFIQQNAQTSKLLDTVDQAYTAAYPRSNGIDEAKSDGSIGSEGLETLLQQFAFNKTFWTGRGGGDNSHKLNGNVKVYDQDGVLHDALEDAGNATKPIAVVPEGYTLPSNQRDESTLGQRYFDVQDALDDATSALYGIPLPLIRHTGGNVRDMVNIMEQSFMREVQTLSRYVSRVLDFSYQAIYGVEDRTLPLAKALEMRNDPDLLQLVVRDSLREWMGEGRGVTSLREPNLADYYSEEDSDSDDDDAHKSLIDRDNSSDSDSDSDDVDRDISHLEEADVAFMDPNAEMTMMDDNGASAAKKSDSSSDDDDEDRNKRSRGKKRDREDSSYKQNFSGTTTQTNTNGSSKNAQSDGDGGGHENSKSQRTLSANASSEEKRKLDSLLKSFATQAGESNRIEVRINIASRVSVNLLNDARESGAITNREFWVRYREHLGLPVDGDVLEELEKQHEESKASASSSSSSGGGGKSANDSRIRLKGVGKGHNQANAKPDQARSLRKGNEKRKMKARNKQSTNARAGRRMGGAPAKSRRSGGGRRI